MNDQTEEGEIAIVDQDDEEFETEDEEDFESTMTSSLPNDIFISTMIDNSQKFIPLSTSQQTIHFTELTPTTTNKTESTEDSNNNQPSIRAFLFDYLHDPRSTSTTTLSDTTSSNNLYIPSTKSSSKPIVFHLWGSMGSGKTQLIKKKSDFLFNTILDVIKETPSTMKDTFWNKILFQKEMIDWIPEDSNLLDGPLFPKMYQSPEKYFEFYQTRKMLSYIEDLLKVQATNDIVNVEGSSNCLNLTFPDVIVMEGGLLESFFVYATYAFENGYIHNNTFQYYRSLATWQYENYQNYILFLDSTPLELSKVDHLSRCLRTIQKRNRANVERSKVTYSYLQELDLLRRKILLPFFQTDNKQQIVRF